MYVETRTTAQQVIEDVVNELNYQANSLVASVRTRQQHPTYITKTQLRESLSELTGAYGLAIRVLGGREQVPDAIANKVTDARAQAKAVLS